MTLVSGFRVHTNNNGEPLYRVPDLLTAEEFAVYMADTFGVKVSITPLSEDESAEWRELMESGEPAITTSPGPTDRQREIAKLRDMLGITELEKRLGAVTEDSSLNMPDVPSSRAEGESGGTTKTTETKPTRTTK